MSDDRIKAAASGGRVPRFVEGWWGGHRRPAQRAAGGLAVDILACSPPCRSTTTTATFTRTIRISVYDLGSKADSLKLYIDVY
ncbi:hypothetical protein NDU88_006057 [Pleurodeles waltl]|uniref:Uncharacterized protein n=1 Tax=Pleurodeles waltl TaxID=8319 RepID=A0AAV7LPD7_PLEWA|nr:hypothetical protein NDU88_006057 [Pleurodeles waltl]